MCNKLEFLHLGCHSQWLIQAGGLSSSLSNRMKAFDTLSIFKLISSYKITSATRIDWYHTPEATLTEDPSHWEPQNTFWPIGPQCSPRWETRDHRSWSTRACSTLALQKEDIESVCAPWHVAGTPTDPMLIGLSILLLPLPMCFPLLLSLLSCPLPHCLLFSSQLLFLSSFFSLSRQSLICIFLRDNNVEHDFMAYLPSMYLLCLSFNSVVCFFQWSVRILSLPFSLSPSLCLLLDPIHYAVKKLKLPLDRNCIVCMNHHKYKRMVFQIILVTNL